MMSYPARLRFALIDSSLLLRKASMRLQRFDLDFGVLLFERRIAVEVVCRFEIQTRRE
jgi:hypothetical protein